MLRKRENIAIMSIVAIVVVITGAVVGSRISGNSFGEKYQRQAAVLDSVAGEQVKASETSVEAEDGFGETVEHWINTFNLCLVWELIVEDAINTRPDETLPPYEVREEKKNIYGKIVYLDPSPESLGHLIEKYKISKNQLHRMKSRALKYIFPYLWVEKGSSNPSAIIVTLHNYEPAAWGVYGYFLGSVISSIQTTHHNISIETARLITRDIKLRLFDPAIFDLKKNKLSPSVAKDGINYAFQLLPDRKGAVFMAWDVESNFALDEKELMKRLTAGR